MKTILTTVTLVLALLFVTSTFGAELAPTQKADAVQKANTAVQKSAPTQKGDASQKGESNACARCGHEHGGFFARLRSARLANRSARLAARSAHAAARGACNTCS